MFIFYFATLFLHGRSGNNIGEALNSDSIILCLWIDFSRPPRGYSCGFCTKDVTGSCTDCIAEVGSSSYGYCITKSITILD